MPDNLSNKSQDIIDLDEEGGIPTIVQCGHILANSRKRTTRARNKRDCENPHPHDVGETIVVTELACLKRQPPYPKGVTDPAIFGDQDTRLAELLVKKGPFGRQRNYDSLYILSDHPPSLGNSNSRQAHKARDSQETL